MSKSHTIFALITFGLIALPAASAFGEVGHCNYRQLSPVQRAWYRVCQSPATPADCEALPSNLKQQVEYGDGACKATGVIAQCTIGSATLFFYQGDVDDLVKGCAMMKGLPKAVAAE